MMYVRRHSDKHFFNEFDLPKENYVYSEWVVYVHLNKFMNKCNLLNDRSQFYLIDFAKSSLSCWRLRLSGLHLDMQVT